jgi:hypothetical protein
MINDCVLVTGRYDVITRRLWTTAILIAAALITTTAAARPPQAQLSLSIAGDADVQVAQAMLTCYPAGGTHPKAVAACAELARVSGDIGRLPAQPVLCTMQYAPVTATATGRWRGRTIGWSKTFSNRCMLAAATGSVFQL